MAEVKFRVLDLETVAIDPPDNPWDGIVEVGVCDVLAKFRDDGAFAGALIDTQSRSLLYAPPGGIPPETRAVHHIGPKDVEGCPPCDERALRLLLSEEPYAFVAHNAAFEMGWVSKAIPNQKWICTMKVAARLEPEWPSHSNQACRYLLGLELDDAVAMPPHRAGPDALVSAHLFVEFLKHTSVRQMVAWTKEPRFLTKCPIGDKWRGKPWAEVEESFLRWAINKPIDDADCIFWMKAELERRAQAARQPVAAEEGEDY